MAIEPLEHMRAKPSFYLRQLTPEVAQDIEQSNYRRISHEAPCPVCRAPAFLHPAIEQNEFLHYLCDGSIVKL